MLVTVYIPTKNRLDLLQRAIKSVQNQTYADIELIVVDDGSTDGTREYLAKEAEAGALKVIFHDKSLGACAARNAAIQLSRGEFITGLDDDDYFLSDRRIELFVEKWKSIDSACAGIFDSAKVISDEGISVKRQSEIATYKQLRQFNLVGNQVFAPRGNYLDAGLFDIEMSAFQDWEMWIRMSERFGPFLNMNNLTYMIDASHDAERISIKSQRDNVLRKAMYRLFQKINNINLFEKSCLIAILYSYPQVKPKFNEICILLMAFRLRLVVYALRKMYRHKLIN
jgi:glycosyltransferase involved in cell wall biosynthesis